MIRRFEPSSLIRLAMPLLNPGANIISLFLFFGAFMPRGLADSASCQPGWEWANNTLQQNPCEVAGILDAECKGFTTFTLGPVKQGQSYLPPWGNDSLGLFCDCNTVMFSLYMACTACQNVSIQSWGYWKQNCVQVYVGQYPGIIPWNTAVPHWAYLNYTIEGEFDPVAAKATGHQQNHHQSVREVREGTRKFARARGGSRGYQLPRGQSNVDDLVIGPIIGPKLTGYTSTNPGDSTDSTPSSTFTSLGDSIVSTLSSTSTSPSDLIVSLFSTSTNPSDLTISLFNTSTNPSDLTVSLSSTPTNPGPQLTITTTVHQSRQGGNLNAIVVGVTGGLVVLVVGACIFFFKRAVARGNIGRSGNIKLSTGAPMSEHGISSLQTRPYDPDDPSTYPTHIHQQNHQSVREGTRGYTGDFADDECGSTGLYETTFRSRYTGAAEL